MGMARHRAKGEIPSEVYVVTDGTSHRLYSSLAAAKGVMTSQRNYDKRYHRDSGYKLYRIPCDRAEEIEYEK